LADTAYGEPAITTIAQCPAPAGAVAAHPQQRTIAAATARITSFHLMKKLPKGKNAKDLTKELFFLLLP
jgi:hypothetical protein